MNVFLLAAGRGRRAGGPKALLEDGGVTALERQLRFLAGLTPPERVSVSIQEAWLPGLRSRSPLTRWVCVDPDLSPLASLQALLRERPDAEDGFLYHVDMPVFEPRVFDTLARAPKDGGEAWVPAFNGRRGHPALLSRALYPEILRLDPGRDRLDAFLRSRRVAEVPVAWPCVLENRNAG
ncbi:MAG: NTP transferase domain-containing protein [Elusimicrobia bacterium]|nr:NTP transferase domain-containing protein [Elusimicrobiota bacterium]